MGHDEAPLKCSTCLARERRVRGVGCYTTVLQRVADINHLDVSQLCICWECEALLRSVVRFQNKVHTATSVLGEISHPSLSTLATALVVDTQELISYDTEPNVELLKAKQENEHIEKYQDFPDDDYNISYDAEHFELPPIAQATDVSNEVEPTQYKHEDVKPGKKKNNSWAIKKALQNKKPKYTVIQSEKTNHKNMFTRTAVSETELTGCLEKERESEYYRNKKYKCGKCITGFARRNLLTAHKKRCHKKEAGKYMCDVCQTRFSERALLDKHYHSHYYKFVCKMCSYACAARSHMLWHYRRTHEKVYQCCECALTFVSRPQVHQHYKARHELFICDHCGTSFKMKYCIEEHIRKQHSPHRCVPCGKRFARYNGLWLHNKLRHNTDTVAPRGYCVECDKHFANVYAYKWHLNNSVTHNRRPRQSVPCPACPKVFTKRTYMRNHHDLVHLKIYRYRCERCDKNFLRNAELVKHTRRVHELQPPRRDKTCRVCGRGFTCNKILTNHIRVHTGERPFACVRCPARFAQRAALSSHLKNVHKHKYNTVDTYIFVFYSSSCIAQSEGRV